MEWKKAVNGGEQLVGEAEGGTTLLGGYKYESDYRAHKAWFYDQSKALVSGDFLFKRPEEARAWVEKNHSQKVNWQVEKSCIEEKKMYLGEGALDIDGDDLDKWGVHARSDRAIQVSKYGICKVQITIFVAEFEGKKARRRHEQIVEVIRRTN